MPLESNVSAGNQASTGHGGKRVGAGRKRQTPEDLARFWQARGYSPLHASEILARVTDERRIWHRILTSPDDRVLLQAMMFLTAMRDGKPAQQINVTSMSVNISADDISKARAIARELVQAREDSLDVRREEIAKPPLMLSADEGGN